MFFRYLFHRYAVAYPAVIPVAGPMNSTMMSSIMLLWMMKVFGTPICVRRCSGIMTHVLYVIMPISMVLIAMAMISRLRFTPWGAPLILNMNNVKSTRMPNIIKAMKVNSPSPGLPRAVNSPPTAPAYVAPMFFINRLLRAKSIACRTINM